ncbi:MAG: mucoidy inhibitor MuiA family protein, partial [Phycisphaerales bacterium]
MKNQTKTLTLAIVVISFWVSVTFADVPTTTGTISKVTVYRGQALVTRKIDIDLPAGASELIVKGLPARIVSESIYAQTSDNIKVLSVRYREYAVRQDTREEVKQLDAQIEDVAYKIKCAERDLKHFEHYGKMFDELKSFTVTAEHADLNRGLLTYEPIEKLAGLIEHKALEYHKQITELQDKIIELEKEKELLQRKRGQLQAGHSRTERQAVLFLNNDTGRKASIELSYLVNGANWQQQYNLRANPQKSNVLIEYNAVVNQASGENWDGVALSLSTAQPTMVAAPPILEPMLVGLSRPAQTQQLEQIQWDVDRTRQYQMNRKANFQKGIAASKELNQLAIDNQAFIFNSSRRQLQQY